MPFPDSPRVIYRRNPLEQVICQLRFEPILRIEANSPAHFQEIIREQYPRFEERTEAVGDGLPTDLVSQLPQEFLSLIQQPGKKSYVFATRDGVWTVTLTRDALALTCSNYHTWDEFKAHLTGPLDALREAYPPTIVPARLGLRYQNVIRRSQIGLSGVPWSELLEPYVAGVLHSRDVESNVRGLNGVAEIQLTDDCGLVRIRSGLAQDKQTGEEVFLIDSDFFSGEGLEVNNVIDRLDSFNRRSGRLFRWCITPQLHDAMGP